MDNVNPYESPQVASQVEVRAASPLKLPAWGILTISALSLVWTPVFLIVSFWLEYRFDRRIVGTADVVFGAWAIVTGSVGIVGGRSMLRMKNRRLVVATAILACVPYIGIAGGCLTAAFGLIALMRLRQKEV